MLKEETIKNGEFYDKIYEQLFLPLFELRKKTKIGNQRSCGFCKKSAPEVSFKQAAHTFPEKY